MSSSDEEIVIKKRRRNQDSDDDWLPPEKKPTFPQLQKRKTKQVSATKKLKLNKDMKKMGEIQIKEEFNSSGTEQRSPNSGQSGLQCVKRKVDSEYSDEYDIPVKKERLTPTDAQENKSSLQSNSSKNIIKKEKQSPKVIKKEKQSPKIIKKENALKQKSNVQKGSEMELNPAQQTDDKTYVSRVGT